MLEQELKITQKQSSNANYIELDLVQEELRKAQGVIMQQQHLLQQQSDMNLRKQSIDRVKSRIIQQLKKENIEMKAIIETQNAQITQLNSEIVTFRTRYEQVLEDLKVANNRGQVIEAQTRKISQIRKVAQIIPPPPPLQKQIIKHIQSNRRYPRKKLRRIIWETLQQTSGTIWEKLNDELIELNWEQIEEQFQVIQVHQPEKQLTHKTSLLTQERQRSIELVMMKYKLTSQIVLDAIKNIDLKTLTTEVVESLIKCLPLDKELATFMKTEVEVNKMTVPDRFLFEVLKLPLFTARLKSIAFAQDYKFTADNISQRLTVIRSACQTIRTDTQLELIFVNLLAIGNFINGDPSKVAPKGIRLDSVEKVLQVKANDHQTIMMYIIEQIEKTHPLKNTQVIQESTKVSLLQVLQDYQEVKFGLIDLEEILRLQEQEVVDNYSTFCKTVREYVTEMDQLILQVKCDYQQLCAYLGESVGNYESDKLFQKYINICEILSKSKQQLLQRHSDVLKKEQELKTKQELEAFKNKASKQVNIKTASFKDLVRMQQMLKNQKKK